MLRLSKKADYALIAMKHLAVRGDRGSSSAREIAGLYDIPIELMAKVLQRLVRHGLLVSDEGQCEQFSKCNVRDPLYRVREKILAALGDCTIAELAADPPTPAPARPAVLHTHI